MGGAPFWIFRRHFFMMYDRIQRQHEAKKDWLWRNLLISAIALVIIIGAAIGGWLYYAKSYVERYESFLDHLSASTQYAYDQNCLLVSDGQQETRVLRKYMFRSYNYISVYGMGDEQSGPLSEDWDLQLIYGDGSTLSLWDIVEKDEKGNTHYKLYLYYEGTDGFTYAYLADNMTLGSIKTTGKLGS